MSEKRRALPLLDRVWVAIPCDVPWSAMHGGDHVRHCDRCDREVHHLSTLTRDEAEALLQRHRGEQLCVKFLRRPDGSILTTDSLTEVQRRRGWRALSALAAGMLTSLLACSPPARSDPAPGPSSVSIAPEPPAIPPVMQATVPTPSGSAPAGRRRDELAWPIATSKPAPPGPPRERESRVRRDCAPGDGNLCGL